MDSQNITLESVQTCKDREAENVKVFVLTPSDLASIGLITKVENGQAVLLPAKKTNNVDTSTTLSQIIARKRSVSFKEVVTVETPHLQIASSSAAASPTIVRNPKRKGPDEQDVTITVVKQNDINAGLNVATAKNHEDVTVTVSRLTSASTSVLRSNVISPQIKRPCGNNAHTATTLLGNATNSPKMKTAIPNNPCDQVNVLSSGTDTSQTKPAGGNNAHGNTNLLGKGVIASPVKMGCKTTPRKPYEEKEKWTPNLIKRTCKLIPMKKPGQPPQTPQQTASSSVGNTDASSISSHSNNPVRTRARRMLSGFAQYWLNSLEDVGYIRCPLRACNYISLSYQDMSAHYATCAGVSITSENMCPVCQKRLNTAENVKLHLIRSHGPKAKNQEEVQSTPSIKRAPKEDPPPRLLVRKRGYSKVHKISWSISLEQKGFIRCLFQNCGFLALNMEEMIKHYGICNGSGSSARIPCPFCNGRVENLDKLDKHILISHAAESKQADTQTETINVVGTPEAKPVLLQNSNDQKDSQKITVGQSAIPGSFAVNVSELDSHQVDQAQETPEYIVPEILYEDFEDGVNSVKSFSNLPTKNGSDSLQNITDSHGENNFLEKLVPEKQKDVLSIRFSDDQSTHCEVVGTESNQSHMPAQEKISDKGYNVKISETVIVSVDPQDITEAEGISANRLASEASYETISLNISDITDLEEGIRVTQSSVNSMPSSEESSTTKININKSNEEEISLASSAVSGCNVSVIQANTLNMKNLNKSDYVFNSNTNGTDDIQGVIGVSDLCSGNCKQEILTKSSAGANCFNVSNISSDKSDVACNDTICTDNLDNSNITWQKTGINCPRFIQSKMFILSDSCETEIRKPLSDVNKLSETVPSANKQPGSHVTPSQNDLFTCSLSNSQRLDHIKNVTNTGSAPAVQQRLVCRNEDDIDIDIDLLSYSALSGGDTIVYSNHQWESKMSAVSSGSESSSYEKSVTDKSRLKTYSKKNSPSSLTDQTKNEKSPCYANSQVLFDRPSAVNFEEDVYVKKDTEATVAAASILCHSNHYNKEHLPGGDGSTQECGNSFLEERQSDQAPPQEDSKCSGTLVSGAAAEKKLLGIDMGSCSDGDKADIASDITHSQETAVHRNSLNGTAASANHLSSNVHNSAKVEEDENFHCIKFVDQPESASVSSEVQNCVGMAKTSTQYNEISVSSVSDASFMGSSVENICDENQGNNKQDFCNVQMNVCELESSKEEQNELTTKPSIANFVQEMNIDYINSEADKFILEDESLSMYLNNSDEFQDKNLLENDTALMPIGSCDHNQDIMSDKLSAKETVTMSVKEKSENTSMQNTVSCDMLSAERRETIISTPVSHNIPDVTLSTEVGKAHTPNQTEVSVEPAGSNMQRKDDKRHSSYCVSESVVPSDEKVKVSSSSTNVTKEVTDILSTASVMDGSVKKNIETQCEKQFQEEHEASVVVNTADKVSIMEDTPCTLCMEEQDNNVSVIRSSQNSAKEEPCTQSVCDVSLAHTENTVGPQQYDDDSIYPHDNKGECVVAQAGRGDVTERKVKDEPSEKIIQAHKELNDDRENNSLTHIRETRVNLNEIDTKSHVLSECLPIPDLPISKQKKTSLPGTTLIKECKSETEGFESSCLHPDVPDDDKSGKTKTISMCQELLSTDTNEGKVKDESNENSIETQEVCKEGNSSTCARESTINLDDIEMKNALPTECSLERVMPLSNQTSKAATLVDSSIKDFKSEIEDVKHSGLHDVAVIVNDVEQEKPTNISMPELHLHRDSTDVKTVSVEDEDCTGTPSNPAVEKVSCEDENMENLKAGVPGTNGNESIQPQQSDFSQNLVSGIISSHDVERRLTTVHTDTSNQKLIIDSSTLIDSEDTSYLDSNKRQSDDGNPLVVDVIPSCGSAMPIKNASSCTGEKSTDSSRCNSYNIETSNSEDIPPVSSVNAVSVGSDVGTSCSQQLDEESVVCVDKTEAFSDEECRTTHSPSSSSIPTVIKHLNDDFVQLTDNTVTSDHSEDYNKSVCLFSDSVADTVSIDADEKASANTSLMLGYADSELHASNCKNDSSVDNEGLTSRKLKSDNLYQNVHLCDKEISLTGNHRASESDANYREHENVQNFTLSREYEDIMATSDGNCKEKIDLHENSHSPVKVLSTEESANLTVTDTIKQEVNSCLGSTESMKMNLKLKAGSDVTVCNASCLDDAPEAVKTESSPISAKENIENVSSTGTSDSEALLENTGNSTTLSSETKECGASVFQVDEKSNLETLCEASKNISYLSASKICRKRKNNECTNTDNSNSKIQILEFDSDKVAIPSSVKVTAETAQCHSGPNKSHEDNTSTENFCNYLERKHQVSSKVTVSPVMSAASKNENTEETSASLKTSLSDDDGDPSYCHEYAEFRKKRDVNGSKDNSRNGEVLVNNNVGASEVMKSNNNQLSHNNCIDTVGAEGMKRMNSTKSIGAVQGKIQHQKRKNSQQELHVPENGAEMAEMPLEKKKYIHSPVQKAEYPERPEEILQSVALCSNKEKTELSTAKCVYNTRHKGTLHTVLKLDQASGFCSPVIGRGRGRGRGRGTVKEETIEQGEGSAPCGRGRGKEGLMGRGRGRPRGRGRGRGKDNCTQELEGCPTPLDKITFYPALVETEPLVPKNEVNVITNSVVASSCNNSTGTVLTVKRKRGRPSLKPQPTERTEVDDCLHGEKKEDGSSNSSYVPHDINTDIKSSSSAAIADVNESEENDRFATGEGEEKNECNNIHSNFKDELFLKENKERVMTSLGRGSVKRSKTRNDKIMVFNDTMFSSEDGQSKEGNPSDDILEDEEYSPQRRKREARRASNSKIPSMQNVKTRDEHTTNASVDYEGSNTVTTREGDQNNGCKTIKSEIEEESFLKENEEDIMLSQRKDSGKQSKTRDDKIMVSNASTRSSEDGQSKEGNTVENTCEADEYSPQRSTIGKKGMRRASTNKIPSKQNETNHVDNMINESSDYGGSNTETTREGDENNKTKNIISNFDDESFSKEDEGGVKTSLRRGRQSKYKMTADNDSMLTNEDEESDEGNTIDDTFEDEEYLLQPRKRGRKEGRRASNRVSSIQGGENHEDSTTNEKVEDGLFSGEHGGRGMRQVSRQRERRTKLSTFKTVYSNEDEQSGEGSFSDESCEDNEYSPYQRRKGKERRKLSWNGGRRKKKRGTGRGVMCRGRGQGLQTMGEDAREFQVKCVKCPEEVTNLSFESHNNQKHNGLSWIEGHEPIETTDERVVQRILFKLRKEGKKWFTCDTCHVAKKSVVGFMSHLQFCQKTSEEREAMKQSCPFCDRYLIPSSMKVHLQIHKSERERQQQEEELIASSMQARKHKRAAAEKATTLMQEFMKGGEDDEPDVEQKVDKDELFKQIGSTRPSHSLRGKWKTAINRDGKVNCYNPGCLFEAAALSEMDQHYPDCPMAPRKGYVCKLCDHQCNEEAEIREHLKDHERSNPAEETDSSAVEENDSELFHERTGVLTSLRVGKPKKQRYKVANKMNFLAKEASGSVVGDRVFAPALRWTAKFHSQHYKDSLFPLFHTELEDWTAVEESRIDEYLPVAKQSMMISHLTMKGEVVALKQQNMEWRKYNLFEAAVKDDAVTMFVGGPVWAMAWCPLPFRLQIQEDPQNAKQYLAITCHRSMEDQYSASRSYSGPGLIQIWCFEGLDSLKSPPIPSLAFAIAHNYGAVWCMEWCPSGCYERKECETEEGHLRRLGLLAVACSDGCIHIFSVCHPDEVIKRQCDSYPVYKTEPVVSLMLEEEEDVKLGGTDWQCLRLSWCKVKDHRIIAGSFSNGMVALWDIETSSNLLYRICGNRKLIFPYHTFQPHGGPVTALAMNPLNERFLMTGSYDRTCKFWDTHDTAEPISSTFKGLVTDGIWLTHWPSAVCAYDDVYSRCHTNSTLMPVRGFGYSPYPLMAQNSVSWSLSYCDWVNSVAQGTSAGELSAIFLHQLLIGVDTEKGMKNKRMILSYAELINLKESVSTSEMTENARQCEKEVLVPCETGEQQVSAAESMTIDDPSLASSNAQAPSGTDSGKISENENVASATHSESECRSSTNRRTDELLPSESRDDDESVNYLAPTIKEDGGLNESQQINDISINENSSYVKYLQKTEQCPEDVMSTSFSSVRDCDTDTQTYDDSQSVLSSWVNSPTYSQASDTNKQCNKKDVTSEQSDSHKSKEITQENLVLNPRTYSDVDKSFGIVLCDFPTDDFSQMPKEARLWMRQSDQMRMFPTEMYPALSINQVAWNPNFRSFLWVASGYQNGLVRLKCVSAMYTKDVERNMLRIRDAYS